MRLSLTDKGLKQFSKMQKRYDFLKESYGSSASERMRFEYGKIAGDLVDLAMGLNGYAAPLIKQGLAFYDKAGRFLIDEQSGLAIYQAESAG